MVSLLGDFEVHESIGFTTNMAGTAFSSSSMAVPPTGLALPLTPGTIQTSGVSMIDLPQTTPSVAGSTEGFSAMLLRDRDPRLGIPTEDMFVTVGKISVHVSDSGATSTGGRCSVS